MRDVIDVDAVDSAPMRSETVETIRGRLEQPSGGEIPLDFAGGCTDGDHEEITSAVALSESTVLPIEPRKQVKAAKAVIFR